MTKRKDIFGSTIYSVGEWKNGTIIYVELLKKLSIVKKRKLLYSVINIERASYLFYRKRFARKTKL